MRFNREDWNEGAQVAAFLIFVIIVMVFMLNACATIPKVEPEACVVNSADKTCWIDKARGAGHPVDKLDEYFCMDSANMSKILEHLSECKYMP